MGKPLSCDICDLFSAVSFGMGMSLFAYLQFKWISKTVNLEALALALKFHIPALSRLPYPTGQPSSYLHNKAGPLQAGKPTQWFLPSGAWQYYFLEQSHGVVPLCICTLITLFAASSVAAKPASAVAQVTPISPWHHYRQRWLIKGF